MRPVVRSASGLVLRIVGVLASDKAAFFRDFHLDELAFVDG
jgi:hypothetical protein